SHCECEGGAGHAPVVLELVGDTLGAGGVLDHAIHQAERPRDVVLVGRSQVDGEAHPARYGVGDVGEHVEPAHRGYQVAADLLGDLAYPADDVGGRDEGVMADAHGRRPRVILDAPERDPGPGGGHD